MRQRARYLVPCTAIVLLGWATQTSAGAPGPADRLATLTRAQRSAELELYAAESAVARARASAVRLERRRQSLDARLARTRRHVAVVRSSLDATNQRVDNVQQQGEFHLFLSDDSCEWISFLLEFLHGLHRLPDLRNLCNLRKIIFLTFDPKRD